MLRLRVGSVVVRFACLPADVVGWALVAAIGRCWGRRYSPLVHDGVLFVELRPASWPARTWFRKRIALTFGHAVLFGAGRASDRNWQHQRVHVDQAEAACVASLLVSGAVMLAGGPLAALVAWATTYVATIAGAALSAWLRGGDPHGGSVHERAAYALERVFERDREITSRHRRADLRA